MKTLLLSNHYEGKPYEILKEAVGDKFHLEVLDSASQEELEAKAAIADYILVSGRLKINQTVLNNAKNLKMIQRTGVGLDNMDLDALKAAGIPLYVNYGVNANSVAEHALMLMLEVLRQTYWVNKRIRDGIWKKQETGLNTHELAGKTVGLVGIGNIGRRVAELLSVFHVNVLYYDKYPLSAEQEDALGVRFCEFEELLKVSDIVSLHCAKNSDNTHLISEKELQMMKQDAVLINTARGGLVDTNALDKALSEGKLLGAGIDVFEEEPILENNPLLKHDNAILSPHISGVSYEAFARMMQMAVENIEAFDKGMQDQIEKNRIV